MSSVTRLGIIIGMSFLACSLAYGAPPVQGAAAAKDYCSGMGYCARQSNTRMPMQMPAMASEDPTHFNLIDGEPLR